MSESRLQTKELIQANTFGQMRVENGIIWPSQSKNSRTERTWVTREDDSEF